MSAVRVIAHAALFWLVYSLVIGVGFSLVNVWVGAPAEVENTIGGVAGLAGVAHGIVFSLRRRRTHGSTAPDAPTGT